MTDIFKGFIGSMVLYLVLPDVGLTKIQTILLLIVGCMVCTALIWWVQEIRVRYAERRRERRFREMLAKTTLRRVC